MNNIEQITIFKVKADRTKDALELCEKIIVEANEFTNNGLLKSSILKSLEDTHTWSQHTVWRSKEDADNLARSFYQLKSAEAFIEVIDQTIYNGQFDKNLN